MAEAQGATDSLFVSNVPYMLLLLFVADMIAADDPLRPTAFLLPVHCKLC